MSTFEPSGEQNKVTETNRSVGVEIDTLWAVLGERVTRDHKKSTAANSGK